MATAPRSRSARRGLRLAAWAWCALVAGGCVADTLGLPATGGGPDAARDAGAVADAAAPGDAGPAPDSGCPAGASTVRGSVVATYFSHEPTRTVPVDLEGRELEALVPGAAGTFDRIPGRIDGPGAYSIPCVPEGRVYLAERFFPSIAHFEVTTSRQVTRETFERGRADAASVQRAGTAIALNLESLEPWQEEHRLDLVTTHETIRLPAPPLGATSLQQVLSLEPGTLLLDGGRGDRAAVIQYASSVGPLGEEYSSASRVITVDPFTTVDGQVASLSGTLRTPSTRPLTLHWRVSELDAHFADRTDGSRVRYYVLVVASAPRSATALGTPVFSRRVEVDALAILMRPGTPDHTAGTAIPVLFPEEQLVVRLFAVIQNGQSSFHPSIVIRPLGRDVSELVVRPELGAPRDLRVTSAGPARALTWNAPDLGTPAYYDGFITGVDGPELWTFETTERHWTIPPDLLAPGRTYWTSVVAQSAREGGLTRAAAPSPGLTFTR